MMIIWSVLEVTYRLGFDRPAQDGWELLSYSVDLLFFADMLVSFRTALLKKDGAVVASQKQVAIAYLQVRGCVTNGEEALIAYRHAVPNAFFPLRPPLSPFSRLFFRTTFSLREATGYHFITAFTA